MISVFNSLSQIEQELVYKAPILVSILIAGADGDIDRKEIQEGIVQAKKRQKYGNFELKGFYEEVETDFEDKLKILLQSYPSEVAKRNLLIEKELSQLNSLLPKLKNDFALQYYHSLCALALKIAQSSGGLLGMKTIGDAEALYVKLPMIKDPSIN